MSFEEKNIKVLPEDTDAFRLLNWHVYSCYCELGEAGLLSSLGFPQMYFHDKYGIFFSRRAANFKYDAQVSPKDSTDLKTEIKKVDTTSLTLLHTFYKTKENLEKPVLTAKTEVVIVAYDEKNHRKTPLPSELVEKINEVRPKALGTH